MGRVDGRTARAQMLFAVRRPLGTLYTTTYADLASYPAGDVLGCVGYVSADPNVPDADQYTLSQGLDERLLFVNQKGDATPTYSAAGQRTVGDLWKSPVYPGHSEFPAARGFYWPVLAQGGTKHSQAITETVTVAGVTHTLTIDMAAGGYIEGWTYDDGVLNLQILNRADAWNRGLQAALEWADSYSGRLIRHAAVQGGSYYSQASGGGSATSWSMQGGVLRGYTVQLRMDGGKTITVRTLPIEFDPDGGLSAPGLPTGHGGGQYRPVLWPSLVLEQRLELCLDGDPHTHRLTTSVESQQAMASGWVDMALGSPLCLVDTFDEIRALDAKTNTDILLSNGTPAATWYEADYTGYLMDQQQGWEDGVGHKGASVLRSGIGGLAARVSGTDMAVACVSRIQPHRSMLAETPGGNCFTWAQNRGGTAGRDGTNVVQISCQSRLTNRICDPSLPRVVPLGRSSTSCLLLTGPWATIKPKAVGVLL